MRLKAVDELAVCDGPAIDGSAQYEVGQLVDPTATVEAVGPLCRIAGQVLGSLKKRAIRTIFFLDCHCTSHSETNVYFELLTPFTVSDSQHRVMPSSNRTTGGSWSRHLSSTSLQRG